MTTDERSSWCTQHTSITRDSFSFSPFPFPPVPLRFFFSLFISSFWFYLLNFPWICAYRISSRTDSLFFLSYFFLVVFCHLFIPAFPLSEPESKSECISFSLCIEFCFNQVDPPRRSFFDHRGRGIREISRLHLTRRV
jgi:hypothetical protein